MFVYTDCFPLCLELSKYGARPLHTVPAHIRTESSFRSYENVNVYSEFLGSEICTLEFKGVQDFGLSLFLVRRRQRKEELGFYDWEEMIANIF